MLAAIASKGADGLGGALGAGDLKTLSEAIVAACDPSDGMVNNFKACRFDVMSPYLQGRPGFGQRYRGLSERLGAALWLCS